MDPPLPSPAPAEALVPVPGTMRVVAFDLETTGLDTLSARIIEFCFLELDDQLRELGAWTELVHPEIPIPADSVKVHQITDAMVHGKPSFRHFAGRVQALVQDAVLVAHNHKFDLEILSRELQRAGQPGLKPSHPCIDTQRVESFVNSHSLAETYKRYVGAEFDGAHRSLADTTATVEVLRRQRDRHPQKLPPTLEGLLVANLERRARPDREQKDWLDHGRRFYADPQKVFRFGFGKYRDCPVLNVHNCTKDPRGGEASHSDYLAWMRDKGDFPEDVKALVVSWIGPPTVRLVKA
ncbi:MAG: polymerase subunit epsilon [Thermoplasmata archaeon]|jgi:DNA polymerase III epsilon subunit-like protein|nr:polymerase subunit epsilon [Thermoplasmata archaeon]